VRVQAVEDARAEYKKEMEDKATQARILLARKKKKMRLKWIAIMVRCLVRVLKAFRTYQVRVWQPLLGVVSL